MSTTVTRTESTTTRFGRVIQYHVTLDGVHFTAERMVGLDDDYSVSTHVGRCGMSFCVLRDRVVGGRGVSAALLALAQALRADPARCVNPGVLRPHDAEPGKRTHAEMCTDPEACGRFNVCANGQHRPDDDPEPGDRCKDCGRDLTWRGPGPYDYDVVTDADAVVA